MRGIGSGPTDAVHFSVHELCKKSFSGGNPNNLAAHAVAGSAGADGCGEAAAAIEQQSYDGVQDCVRRVVREEGFRALYASYRTTVLMNAPFTTIHFATYEAAKKGLVEVSPETARDERLVVHTTAAAAAGALAAALTTPLDVVKTQLQFQGRYE